ncbi:MAG: FkbM family methyltransferase [Desulfobulbus sp.]|jgi:FkbM family methyltransferase
MKSYIKRFYMQRKKSPSSNPVVHFFENLLVNCVDLYRFRYWYKIFAGLQLINKFKVKGLGTDSRTWLILPYLSKLGIRKRYGSQCFQAMFVTELVHVDVTDGVFLDVGANDPVHINNTWYLERLGWTGLAFEPIPRLAQKWPDSGRKTPCLPICLGREKSTARFLEYERDFMSGMADKVCQSGGEVLRGSYDVPVRRLEDVLEEHDITHVHYMSLDVEGSELDVLAGVNFDKVTFDLISIENEGNFWQKWPIRKFMLNAGFYYCARLWHDDVFVSREIFERLQ